MKLKLLFVVLFLAVAVTPAKANILTAKELAGYCQTAIDIAVNANKAFTPDEAFGAGVCRGFVEAFALSWDDTTIVIDGEAYYMKFRPGTTNREDVRVFLSYVKAHPEKQDKSAFSTLMEAFVDAKILGAQKVNIAPKAVDQ